MKSLAQMEMLNMPAPEFKLKDHTGMPHSIADFRDHWVILYFYPKDMTPGCTLEAQEFRDHGYEIDDLDAVVIGVSRDDAASHKKFCEGESLDFILLSDIEGETCRLYDVLHEKTMFGSKQLGVERTTFLIDKEGKIRKIYNKVKPVGHAIEVLKDIRAFEDRV